MAEPDSEPMLRVRDLSGPSWAAWRGMTFALSRGDVLLVRGESGCGKTTLLKSLADLLPCEHGEIALQGRPLPSLRAHAYRARVIYVPQRPAILPGSPREFMEAVYAFAANRDLGPLPEPHAKANGEADPESAAADAHAAKGWKLAEIDVAHESAQAQAQAQALQATDDGASVHSQASTARNGSRSRDRNDSGAGMKRSASRSFSRAPAIPADPIFLSGAEWALPTSVWDREWSQISGGEGQRVGLAVPLCLIAGKRKGEGVLLLDEPTSALDSRTAAAVEKTLLLSRTALTLVWITHSDDQARRIVALVDEDNQRRKAAPAKYDDSLTRDRKVFSLHLNAPPQIPADS